MRELFSVATEYVALVIDAMALVVIAAGTAQAFVSGFATALSGAGHRAERGVWLRYARWLVAGLTLQLAADIVETSVAPTWSDIGRVGAIAVIRTFLNYFLERDIGEMREKSREAVAAESG